jgi:hypothetical protein
MDRMNKIRLVVPEAPAQQAVAASERRSIKGGGLRLGTLDNSKSNADHLLRMLIDGIKAHTEVASVVSLRKPSVSEPAHAHLLDQLAREADLVISAMAD